MKYLQKLKPLVKGKGIPPGYGIPDIFFFWTRFCCVIKSLTFDQDFLIFMEAKHVDGSKTWAIKKRLL